MVHAGVDADPCDAERGGGPVPVHVHQEVLWLGGLRLLNLYHDPGQVLCKLCVDMLITTVTFRQGSPVQA